MKPLIVLVCILLTCACARKVDSPYGFSLPEGDSKKGEEVFLYFSCLSCHTLADYKVDDIKQDIEKRVALGGEYSKVKTYAELVTSVINPSHKLAKGYTVDEISNDEGKSKMRNYNEVMTVDELVNLVSFLQPYYTVKPATHTQYKVYYP
ncbi:cytochrome C [Agarilytica rhodophyticola]|uniref:cytochrome C n=1 Tax=Agarilytica rhodophyticola TaxID=1737490 RepID=UPI001C1F7381|nr:cytochrome C [Agarilytica rhodophyticola]